MNSDNPREQALLDRIDKAGTLRLTMDDIRHGIPFEEVSHHHILYSSKPFERAETVVLVDEENRKAHILKSKVGRFSSYPAKCLPKRTQETIFNSLFETTEERAKFVSACLSRTPIPQYVVHFMDVGEYEQYFYWLICQWKDGKNREAVEELLEANHEEV